jgi:peptidoglycan hydrolase-like protein with peptidoglycan-binding domain
MARPWRIARALDTLLAQVNEAAPHRSKVSDGGIGNAEHAARTSDHNPYIIRDGIGIVRARDFTHDPAGGFDAYAFAETIRVRQDPRLRYVISCERIASGPAGPAPGKWRPYTGENQHRHHTHVSVVEDVRFDDPAPWDGVALTALTDAPSKLQGDDAPPPPADADGVLEQGESGDAVTAWQGELWRIGYGVGPHDGVYGDATTAQTRLMQAAAGGLDVDGKCGPATREASARVPDYPKPAGPAMTWAERNGGAATARAFQQRLHDRGWPLVVDGAWGDRSADVLQQFQRQAGIDPDGVGGAQAWTALWLRPIT